MAKFQIIALFSNVKPEDFMTNLALTAFSFACLVMFGMAFCDPNKQMLAFIALSATNLRLILRIAGFGDFHETDYILWLLLLVINSMGTFFNYSFLAANFKYFRTRNIVVSVMILLQFVATYNAVDTYKRNPEDYSFKQYLKDWGVILLFFCFLFF